MLFLSFPNKIEGHSGWCLVTGTLAFISDDTSPNPAELSIFSVNFYLTFMYCQLYWKDENKEKEHGIGPFLKSKLFEKNGNKQEVTVLVHFKKVGRLW